MLRRLQRTVRWQSFVPHGFREEVSLGLSHRRLT